jgi:hypothetical protein
LISDPAQAQSLSGWHESCFDCKQDDVDGSVRDARDAGGNAWPLTTVRGNSLPIFGHLRGLSMSLTIPSSTAALSAAVQSHAHGHKKGSQLDLSSQLDASSDSAATAAAKAPAGSTQNALSRLFGFVARTIGIPLPPAATDPAALNAGSAAASSPATGSKINLTA